MVLFSVWCFSESSLSSKKASLSSVSTLPSMMVAKPIWGDRFSCSVYWQASFASGEKYPRSFARSIRPSSRFRTDAGPLYRYSAGEPYWHLLHETIHQIQQATPARIQAMVATVHKKSQILVGMVKHAKHTRSFQQPSRKQEK